MKLTLKVWERMLMRCNDRTHTAWQYFGGRGVEVCERWYNFENFIADMGPRPSNHTLERINRRGNYEPTNCQWAQKRETAYIPPEVPKDRANLMQLLRASIARIENKKPALVKSSARRRVSHTA